MSRPAGDWDRRQFFELEILTMKDLVCLSRINRKDDEDSGSAIGPVEPIRW
jgi:hypothetical protein